MRIHPFRHLTLLAAACSLGAALHGQAAAVGDIRYDGFTLANGLQVVYAEDHTVPVVAVDLWYNVGSRNERPGRTGFAHLFEHMMFEGSAHVAKSAHFQYVERAGGQLNGSTNDDRTNYWDELPSNRLNLALWLEADRMRSLAITQANFENQRETVKEERRLRIDNQPYGAAFSDGFAWPFDTATCFPYAHTTIGSMDDLNAAKLPDVQAFFDTYYAPNNATLVVTGDFQPAELKRLVTSDFGAIPRHDTPPPVSCTYTLSPGTQRRDVPDAHATLPASIRYYRVPARNSADIPALELLATILGQGESSRLNVGVVRRAKAALAAGASMDDERRGPGVFLAFGVSNQGVTIEHVDSLVSGEIDSVRANGVSETELTKAKNQFRAGYIGNRETALSRAEEIHSYLMFHDSLSEINTDLARYLAVTVADIRRVASTYLDPANVVIVTVKPAPSTGGNQ
jgi:predicted Zn-dependent peptidase